MPIQLFGFSGGWLAPPVLLAMVFAALRFDPRGDGWLPVWLSLSIAGAVYSNTYDLLLLIVPMVLAAGALPSRRAAFVIVAGAVLLLPVMWYLHTVYVRGYAAGVALLMFFLVAIASASAQISSNRPANWAQPVIVTGITNCYQVTSNLYRGAQPTDSAGRWDRQVGTLVPCCEGAACSPSPRPTEPSSTLAATAGFREMGLGWWAGGSGRPSETAPRAAVVPARGLVRVVLAVGGVDIDPG